MAEPVITELCAAFCSARPAGPFSISECPREDLKLSLFLGFDAGLRKNEIIQAVPSWFPPGPALDRPDADADDVFQQGKKPRTIPMRARLHGFLHTYGLREPFHARPEAAGRDIYR